MSDTPLVHNPPAASAWMGAAQRDITPPVGIYARQWGAAKHDVATGVHRQLSLTALAIRAGRDQPPLILLAGDLTWFRHPERDLFERMLEPLGRQLGLDSSRIILNCSHTHAGCSITADERDQPGGEMIEPYLDSVAQAVLDAAREAVATAQPATLTWATGRCDLAANRDLPEPPSARTDPRQRLATLGDQRAERVLCGYNPANPADDTVLVGRITRDRDDAVLATLVNYACHPTTLAWENSLISPDYVGAMRETVQQHTGGAPCLFLQGASGELAPAHQYTGDTAVADAHGRRLGLAVVAALAAMLPPRQGLAFERAVESGAPLAVWRPRAFQPPDQVRAVQFDVPLPLKEGLPTLAEIDRQLAQTTDRTLAERLARKRFLMQRLGGGATSAMPAWVWRVGQTLFIMQPNEAYSRFQQDLRQTFPDHAVVVTNVSNGTLGYLPPTDLYDTDIYQVWQTPFAREGLQTLTRLCIEHARQLLEHA